MRITKGVGVRFNYTGAYALFSVMVIPAKIGARGSQRVLVFASNTLELTLVLRNVYPRWDVLGRILNFEKLIPQYGGQYVISKSIDRYELR